MSEHHGSFGEDDVDAFGVGSLEVLARSTGSGDLNDMANYLEQHGDADVADAVAVGIENAAEGCLSWLFSTNAIFAFCLLSNSLQHNFQRIKIALRNSPNRLNNIGIVTKKTSK